MVAASVFWLELSAQACDMSGLLQSALALLLGLPPPSRPICCLYLREEL